MLLELVVVITVLAVMVGSLLQSLTQGSPALLMTQRAQIGSELAQACAEHLIGLNRNPTYGYSAVTATACGTDLPAPPTGFNAPAVTVGPDVTGGAGNPWCPTGSTCKKVRIDVTTTAGDYAAGVTFMVVNL